MANYATFFDGASVPDTNKYFLGIRIRGSVILNYVFGSYLKIYVEIEKIVVVKYCR
jgi:hypothetical protein